MLKQKQKQNQNQKQKPEQTVQIGTHLRKNTAKDQKPKCVTSNKTWQKYRKTKKSD